MITHYGLFWSERDVFWGKQGKAGELLGRENAQHAEPGRPKEPERERSKDFRKFIGLYCLYGDNELLYIGEAGLSTRSERPKSIFDRLRQHRKGIMAGRWDHFSWFGRTPRMDEDQTSIKNALKQLEAITIAIINPGFNKQSGTFANAKQVFQSSHEESDGDLETKLSRIDKDLQKIKNALKIEEKEETNGSNQNNKK